MIISSNYIHNLKNISQTHQILTIHPCTFRPSKPHGCGPRNRCVKDAKGVSGGMLTSCTPTGTMFTKDLGAS